MPREGLPEALLRSEAYRHEVYELTLVETALSWVFLTGPYAYKVKRPITLPYVDYGSLRLRRHFCREELRLNSRLTPELYLGVVPIVADGGRLRVAAPGRPVEYAVQMVQFPQDSILLRAIAAGRVTIAQLRRFGRFLASFHSRSGGEAGSGDSGAPEVVRGMTLGDLDLVRDSLLSLGSRAGGVDRFASALAASWPDVASTLASRRERGAVRELHGDLHGNNLVLLDGRVRPFDGVEFDPSFRWQDVLSEVAFVIMDLEVHGHRELAAAFRRGYEAGSELELDDRALAWLRAFRALVRSKVAAVRATQVTPGARRPELARSRLYLDYGMACLEEL